jgi:hypothetical protein
VNACLRFRAQCLGLLPKFVQPKLHRTLAFLPGDIHDVGTCRQMREECLYRQRSRLAIRSTVPQDGELMPRSIGLRKSTEIPTSSAKTSNPWIGVESRLRRKVVEVWPTTRRQSRVPRPRHTGRFFAERRLTPTRASLCRRASPPVSSAGLPVSSEKSCHPSCPFVVCSQEVL